MSSDIQKEITRIRDSVKDALARSVLFVTLANAVADKEDDKKAISDLLDDFRVMEEAYDNNVARRDVLRAAVG